MAQGSTNNIKLWRVMVIAVICWVALSGLERNLAADNEEAYKGLKIFSEVIDIIEKNYVEETEERDLIEKAIQGMVQRLDPHSAFLPPEALEDLQVDTQGEFGGIGIQIEMPDGVLTVVSPIDGTPAAEAGIQAEDKIIKVDGELTKDMTILEAVKKMRGPKGTEVVITIFREGVAEPIDFKLIRDTIPIESVRSGLIRDGYGYVRITNFREKTTADLREALATLESGSVPLKGLILDLRNNPGGLLDQSVDVADLFLEQGIIVSMKGRNDRDQRVFSATPNLIKRDYPMVVLINNGSASASEIVAGALQDQKRALILGTTSFGKGSVQNVEALRDGYGLKLTIARYYTPSGESIQAQGIIPDIEVLPKIIEDDDTDLNRGLLIKEKDLKNHLEPEITEAETTDPEPEKKAVKSKKNGDDEEKKGEQEEEDKKDPPAAKRGGFNPELLMSDWQVVRALEILVGYDVFKGLGQ